MTGKDKASDGDGAQSIGTCVHIYKGRKESAGGGIKKRRGRIKDVWVSAVRGCI